MATIFFLTAHSSNHSLNQHTLTPHQLTNSQTTLILPPSQKQETHTTLMILESVRLSFLALVGMVSCQYHHHLHRHLHHHHHHHFIHHHRHHQFMSCLGHPHPSHLGLHQPTLGCVFIFP